MLESKYFFLPDELLLMNRCYRIFTHYVLVDSSTVTCWTSPFVILGCQVYFHLFFFFLIYGFYSIFDGIILLANNVDPDQMPHYVASDLGLHCLPMTLLWFSR